MDLKPIRNETDYKSALLRLEQLMMAQPDTEEGDELDLLAELVNIYEERHFPIDPPSPIEAIAFRMEQMGVKQKEFGKLIGSQSHASEVMNKKRHLSMSMAQKLHKEWRIPADALLQTYDLAVTK